VERSCGLTNRNRIRGCCGRTSGLPITKSITIKGHCSISGRRAAKAVELTPGDLRCCLEIGAERVVRRAERSTEVSRGHIRRDVLPLKARTVRSGE
jgi:hypothetical protein